MKRNLFLIILLSAIFPFCSLSQKVRITFNEDNPNGVVKVYYDDKDAYQQIGNNFEVPVKADMRVIIYPDKGSDLEYLKINGIQVKADKPAPDVLLYQYIFTADKDTKIDIKISDPSKPLKWYKITFAKPEKGVSKIVALKDPQNTKLTSGEMLKEGRKFRLAVFPISGYYVHEALINGKSVMPVNRGNYSIINKVVENNYDISFVMKKGALPANSVHFTSDGKNGVIEIMKMGNGSINYIDPGMKVCAGTELTIRITPDIGSAIESLTINGENIALRQSGDMDESRDIRYATYVMPDKDITLNATITDPTKPLKNFTVNYKIVGPGTAEVHDRVSYKIIPSGGTIKEGRELFISLHPKGKAIAKSVIINGMSENIMKIYGNIIVIYKPSSDINMTINFSSSEDTKKVIAPSSISIQGNSLTMKSGTNINYKIYEINGITISAGDIHAGEKTIQLKTGSYIIRLGETSYKVTIR